MHPEKRETPSAPQPVRQELNRLKLSGLTLVETQHAPGYTTPPHVHAAASLCLTLAGQGSEISNGTRITTQPGCVIVRAPELVHSNQFGGAVYRGFMIELENKWLNSCRHIAGVFAGHKHFAGGPVAELALRIYRESRIRDSVAPVIVEGMMLELLGHASRSLIKTPVRPPAWLTRARDLLHAQFNDPLNLIEIANLVGVHPTHLARTFKKHYRATVGDYLRRLRLDWATRQLAETDTSIAEIALAAGFYDQSHFSHLFKQHTGFTPAEFRASQTPPQTPSVKR